MIDAEPVKPLSVSVEHVFLIEFCFYPVFYFWHVFLTLSSFSLQQLAAFQLSEKLLLTCLLSINVIYLFFFFQCGGCFWPSFKAKLWEDKKTKKQLDFRRYISLNNRLRLGNSFHYGHMLMLTQRH